MSKELFNHLCTRLTNVTNFKAQTNVGAIDTIIRGEVDGIHIVMIVRDITDNLVKVEVSASESTEYCTLGFTTAVDDVTVVVDSIVKALQDCVGNVTKAQEKYKAKVDKI